MTLHALIILLPLLGAILIGLTGFLVPSFRQREKLIGTLATLAVAVPFVIVLATFLGYNGTPVDFTIIPWLETQNISLGFSYRLDQLSLIMGLVVTGVGSVIHVYSIGYMHGDKGFYKFFLYLNLFIFAMNNLILADNMLVTFLGWEGVGACSYFLIGFWFQDMEKAKAAQKAFVANRIGDFAFLVAMFLCLHYTGSLRYTEILAAAPGIPADITWWLALLVFIAATGKSAQIPLYVWLPDAMAGPTPVSALIHAATMVTSGIYLIARMGEVYLLAPAIMEVVAVVGALTALLAALIAIAQNDIKKVLAYSTVSQLGFMFMALGVGAFTTAIFHVMTHAFFKACLFLGSGSVIHAMEHAHAAPDPQDIRTMGGLGKYMRSTSTTFWISTLAIAGIPPLAGFFSKDEILGKLFFGGEHHLIYLVVYGIATFTALLTAFYMTRVTFLTFNGKERYQYQATGHGHAAHDAHGHGANGHDTHGHDAHDTHSAHGHGAHHHHKPHESSPLLTVPLWILAVLAVVGGWVGLPAVIGHGHYNLITPWLEGSVHNAGAHHELTPELVATEWMLILGSIVIALIGVGTALALYRRHDLAGDAKVQRLLGPLYRAMENKFYVDELYNATIIRPTVWFSDVVVARWFDRKVIDGVVDGTGTVVRGSGEWLRRLQSGLVQQYATLMVAAALFMLAYLVF